MGQLRLEKDILDTNLRSPKPSLFIALSGPGGTGKTTLVQKWLRQSPDIEYIPNVTTRKPRPASLIDETGLYEFVTFERFRELVEEGAFAQWVNPSPNKYYGTPIQPLYDAIKKGCDVVLDYTPQLYINFRRKFPDRTIGIFIIPPSLRHLLERLINRGTETGIEREIKIKMALQDLGYVGDHDYYLINDDIDETLETLKAIRRAESHRLNRHPRILSNYSEMAINTMLFYYDPLDERLQEPLGAESEGGA